MHLIDWLLVIVPLAIVFGFAIYTNRYVHGVADFLSAGRCAGRYLLANARGESDAGLSNTMSKFEIILVSGFVLNFWEKISTPLLLLISISGFVVYRFRETRALTLGQFLETRYSRGFRLYMGFLAFLSGILNYGVFPAISARFFIFFLDLPATVSLGPLEMTTFSLIMLIYLTATVIMILIGGQVTMMIADCLEGLFSHLVYIIIAVGVFYIVNWHQVMDVMEAAPAGKSLINPFDAGDVKDFNVWFVLMAFLLRVYSTMSLQNKQGFNSAARSAHESRMGAVLGEWRGYARMLMLLMLGVCAVTFMRHPAFAAQAAPIHGAIDQIQDAYLKKQMTVPIALRYLLPVGLKGLFVAIMIMGLLAGDAGHMHSWGSIFVQDVVLPLRRTAMSPRQHLWMLRLAIIGVALFAFVFSLLWPQSQYIALWWALTAGVFTGACGAPLIGGLYWKRGTTAAAWASAIVGSTLSLLAIVASNSDAWSWIRDTAAETVVLPTRFWLNGQEMAFAAACVTVVVYVAVSLITSRTAFNLDRMLHRGIYAREGEQPVQTLSWRERLKVRNILRFDKNFTFWDKLVSGGIFWWAIVLLVVNMIVTIWNLAFRPWPIDWWAHYWLVFGIGLPCAIALGTLVWFSIGGIKDMFDFFYALRTMKRDAADDGRVAPTPEPAAALGPRSLPVAATVNSCGQVSDPSAK